MQDGPGSQQGGRQGNQLEEEQVGDLLDDIPAWSWGTNPAQTWAQWWWSRPGTTCRTWSRSWQKCGTWAAHICWSHSEIFRQCLVKIVLKWSSNVLLHLIYNFKPRMCHLCHLRGEIVMCQHDTLWHTSCAAAVGKDIHWVQTWTCSSEKYLSKFHLETKFILPVK